MIGEDSPAMDQDPREPAGAPESDPPSPPEEASDIAQSWPAASDVDAETQAGEGGAGTGSELSAAGPAAEDPTPDQDEPGS